MVLTLVDLLTDVLPQTQIYAVDLDWTMAGSLFNGLLFCGGSGLGCSRRALLFFYIVRVCWTGMEVRTGREPPSNSLC